MQKIEQTISSLEVAEMTGKRHDNLMRSMITYEKHFSQLKIEVAGYFQPTTYKDEQGKERKSYNITKKGCEFIAHKMTGIKGTEFTVKYIDRFHDMEQAMTQVAVESKQKPRFTPEEIVDWKLDDLNKRLKILEESQPAKSQGLGRLTPRKDTWYEKNRSRIWRIRYDKDIELKELYHIILEECGKYYDLEEAERLYRGQNGRGFIYPIDVVEHFPELQEIANQVLDYFEG